MQCTVMLCVVYLGRWIYFYCYFKLFIQNHPFLDAAVYKPMHHHNKLNRLTIFSYTLQKMLHLTTAWWMGRRGILNYSCIHHIPLHLQLIFIKKNHCFVNNRLMRKNRFARCKPNTDRHFLPFPAHSLANKTDSHLPNSFFIFLINHYIHCANFLRSA